MGPDLSPEAVFTGPVCVQVSPSRPVSAGDAPGQQVGLARAPARLGVREVLCAVSAGVCGSLPHRLRSQMLWGPLGSHPHMGSSGGSERSLLGDALQRHLPPGWGAPPSRCGSFMSSAVDRLREALVFSIDGWRARERRWAWAVATLQPRCSLQVVSDAILAVRQAGGGQSWPCPRAEAPVHRRTDEPLP